MKQIATTLTAATLLAMTATPASAADTTGLQIPPRAGSSNGAARDPFGREPVAVRPKPKVLPQPVLPAVIEVPTAPPLPYTFTGRLVINQVERVLLLQGERVIAVAPGDALGEFRFERDERNLLRFMHLPTGQPVTLGTAQGGNVSGAGGSVTRGDVSGAGEDSTPVGPGRGPRFDPTSQRAPVNMLAHVAAEPCAAA